jgi:5-methylcytosine-specific restriction endonuclease McrA
VASPRTVRWIHTTLHKALKQAVRWGLIVRNVAGVVQAPRWARKELRVLSPEEVGSVEEFIKEILQYEGEGLPGRLQPGPSRSEKIAEESLQVDDVTHGEINEKVVPDSEGRKRLVQHAAYERSQKNRRLAIEKHGITCAVCSFNFDEIYGKDYAEGNIQIHHIKPVSEYEGEVDPETDLVPLCANCHAMAHKRRKTVTSTDELKALIEKAKG